MRAAIHRRRFTLAFARGVRTRSAAYRGPVEVQIGISNRCNNRCIMCWAHMDNHGTISDRFKNDPDVDADKEDMPVDVFESVVKELTAMGTEKITLVGRGEPLLNPHFLEMVEIVKKNRVRCTVITNGVLLTPVLMSCLIELDLDELNVSVNAATQDSYEKVNRQYRKDGLQKILDVVATGAREKRHLGKNKPEICLSFVLTRVNSREAFDMARISGECGADKVNYLNVYYVTDATAELLMTGEQFDEFNGRLGEIKRFLDERGILNNVQSLMAPPHLALNSRHPSAEYIRKYPCYAGWAFCVIYADGTVCPCCEAFFKIGNVREQSFREIWNGERYRKFRKNALSLPALKGNVPNCMCDSCGYANLNTEYHNLLEGYRKWGFCRT